MIPISYNLRSLKARKATTAATALGIGLVVFVLAAALMLQAGIRETMTRSGSAENAIVIRKGSDNEMGSAIEEPTVALISAAPGVASSADGKANATAEVVVVIFLNKRGEESGANVTVRGVKDNALAFRPEVKIIDGRRANPGVDEVIVGKAIYERFEGLEIGKTIELRKNRPVTVVGVFEAEGSALESEVWGDLDTIRSSFGREGIVSSVRVRLASASKFDAFQLGVEQDKRLGLTAMREDEFYEKQSEGTSIMMGVMGIVIAFFSSFGAMIGAAITMYAAVASRSREIGILRALGFSRFAIMSSFVVEAGLLALVGGVIGAVASLSMGLVKFSMINFASWSQVVFEFHPEPQIIVISVVAGGVMGLLGGFFPALRAARTAPVEAMRG